MPLLPLDLAQLINRLGVVRHRAVAVHRDGDRPHAEETKGHQTEGKDGRGEQEFRRHEREQRGILGEIIRGAHQRHDAKPHPERGEIARHESGQNVQRRATMLGAIRHFAHMTGAGADEHLGELRDHRASHRAATDDARQHPPQSRLRGSSGISEIAQQHFARDEGDGDGNRRGDPNEMRQRRFEIEILLAAEHGFAQAFVHEVGDERRHDHQRAHDEQPDDERRHDRRRGRQRQREEGDQAPRP